MKINLKDITRVNTELLNINEKATRHTFTDAHELLRLTNEVEKDLAGYGVAESNWKGISAVLQSGDILPNAYKYRTTTTTVVLVRGTRDWFLTNVRHSTLGPKEVPHRRIFLSKELVELIERKRQAKHHIAIAA